MTLGALPFSAQELERTAGFIGTAGDYAHSLLRTAAEKGFTDTERRSFSELYALAGALSDELSALSDEVHSGQVLFDDQDVVHAVLTTDIEKIEITRSEVDQTAFNSAVEQILKADHVYILGMRSSSSLASFMGYYLNLLRDDVHVLQDLTYSEIYEQIIHIKEGDVFIGISYPRYSSRTVKAMRFAHSTGAYVIGITDGETSPFVGLADTNLFARSDMVSFLDSLVAPMSLINALIVAIGLKTNEQLAANFKRLESIWSEFEVYETLEN